MKIRLVIIFMIFISMNTHAQTIIDSLKKNPKNIPYGMVGYSARYTQIPFTPIYVVEAKKWFRNKGHFRIIRLGRWYVPFISKRK